jgi:hypothetical protein
MKRLLKSMNIINPDVKQLKVRIPHSLRRHPDFENAIIKVDQDQIHFQLKDPATKLPELWVYVAPKDDWVNVQFVTDAANPTV